MDDELRDFVSRRFRAPEPAGGTVTTLADAVRAHVRPGDSIHLGSTHARGAAAAWEIVRQFRGSDPGFELVATSMSTVTAPLVHERLARKVITSWSGDQYYAPGPSPVFRRAHAEGVVFEHWSILTLPQRLAAAARGHEWTATRSLIGSSMAADNAADIRQIEPDLALIRALTPDVSLFHAPAADAEGTVLMVPPLFENVYGALAARRGAIVTVEKIVDPSFTREHAHLARIPASAVLAVIEVPFGAHPGGVFARGVPGVVSYGEDYDFWHAMRTASKDPAAYDAWIAEWILDPPDRRAYNGKLGEARLDALVAHSDPTRLPPPVEAAIGSIDQDAPATPLEAAITFGARLLRERVTAAGHRHMLAGAGMANLAAWLAATDLQDRGIAVDLVAEMGLVGYRPSPGEPFIFNHRNFPACTMLTDIDVTMSILMGGARAKSIASLGAAQIDKEGNINTTIAGGSLLMGSGGANDVATCATESVVTATQRRERFVDRVEYVTSPGDRVVALASQYGVYRKDQGELILTGVFGDDAGEAVTRVRETCGWNVRVARTLERLEPPTRDEVRTLRVMDPKAYFRE